MIKNILLIKDTSLGGEDSTRALHAQFMAAIKEAGAEGAVQAVRAADLGLYDRGAVVKILPGGQRVEKVRPEDVGPIVRTVVSGAEPEGFSWASVTGQVRRVMRHCGVVDPESLEDALNNGGAYQALKRCLKEMTPENVIEAVKTSGLRGRGGAGYPTWMKWSIARRAMGSPKTIICNADEGDPGAYMDRSVLEGDPHAVLEGMLIAGYAVGASQGVFYVRAEYPVAVQRIQKALDQAADGKLLGANILGSSFSFEAEIRLGAGAFVCGEETALIASVEGRRGTPRPRPPYPSDVGLWDKPTVINNVETLANVPLILEKGGEWFSRIGTEKSKGTKVFALTGKVQNSGLVEIAMGTTLREIVYGAGGGMANRKGFLAVQTGGPSGGLIPASKLDTPVSYEHLVELGSHMGSGGMIVLDQDDCIVDIVRFYLGFCVDESCGKCAPCKIGGYQMLKVLDRIAGGEGQEEDLAVLKRLAHAMQRASLCGLGQSAPTPVLSALRHFEQEVLDHVLAKKCRAGKCTALLRFSILPESCKRCRLCVASCPVNAITGDREKGYEIDQSKCIKCGKCLEVCKFNAVSKH